MGGGGDGGGTMISRGISTVGVLEENCFSKFYTKIFMTHTVVFVDLYELK